MHFLIVYEVDILEWYVKLQIEPSLVTVRNSNTIPRVIFKKQDDERILNNWEMETICEQRVREIKGKERPTPGGG